MAQTQTAAMDFKALYALAFKKYRLLALWNVRMHRTRRRRTRWQ